jgi:RNA polymerase sigma-70 factor (ECF subfamily)
VRAELQEAIALLHQADADSVDRAIQLLHRTVLSFGMKFCGHREDAEDTVQEVLLHALPHLAKLHNPQELSAWLYTAAKNRCWQTRKRASYRRSVALTDLIPDEIELAALLLADHEPTPEAQAVSHEDHRMLHRAVLSLPSRYRMVLVLHDMEELSTEVVAKILSLQPGTVRVRLHRARLLVRQQMDLMLHNVEETPKPLKRTSKHPKRRPVQQPAECREIFANLSEYLDGRMRSKSCEQMRSHIEGCPACVAFIHDLKRAIDRCRSLDVCPDAAAPPALRRLLTQEYLRLVQNSSPNL